MSATIMNGTELAARMKAGIACEAKSLDRVPGLAMILLGDSPAAQVYARGKQRDCEQCGFHHQEYVLPKDVAEEEVIALIQMLNEDEKIHGILMEMPLPDHLNERRVLDTISPAKDVDCLTTYSYGQMQLGDGGFPPCTPAGVMELLNHYGISLTGKHCVMVGSSNIVGKPLSMLLLQQKATVSICHSKTENLVELCQGADIIFAAAGRINLITADMVKEGAVIIDVAVNRTEDGKLCGDVDYEAVSKKASYITPVPGGTGPMTRVMVLKHLLMGAKK